MRMRKRQCPQCQSPTEAGYRYCLACGLELPAETAPAEEIEKTARADARAYRTGKIRCWQCDAKLAQPSPACPTCGADLVYPRRSRTTPDQKPPDGKRVRLSRPRIAIVVLVTVLVLSGLTFLVVHTGFQSGARENELVSLPGLVDPDVAGGDEATRDGVEAPAGIPEGALEVVALAVNANGTIQARVQGQEITLSLVGVADEFVSACLGEIALARLKRIVPPGSTLFILPDREGNIDPKNDIGLQPVYLWSYDAETTRIRFANEEMIASGEVEFPGVDLIDSGPAKNLTSAAARAKDNFRGRYEADACS